MQIVGFPMRRLKRSGEKINRHMVSPFLFIIKIVESAEFQASSQFLWPHSFVLFLCLTWKDIRKIGFVTRPIRVRLFSYIKDKENIKWAAAPENQQFAYAKTKMQISCAVTADQRNPSSS